MASLFASTGKPLDEANNHPSHYPVALTPVDHHIHQSEANTDWHRAQLAVGRHGYNVPNNNRPLPHTYSESEHRSVVVGTLAGGLGLLALYWLFSRSSPTE